MNMADMEDRDQRETRFLQWLRDHGAAFPKIQWPVTTPNGLRGATALEPIAANEIMLSIPRVLMISEETCWSDPELGPIYEENRDIFTRDDPVLALFLTRELSKGDASFYAPYLSILPEVINVQDWTDKERSELRDRSLEDAAQRRVAEVNSFYERVMHRLESKYPGVEVFNSYGRRPNFQLLLDYGFALVDNEMKDFSSIL
ncbi:hypothetical protein P43SY_002516 [Pythium insidiosum]|uniref:Uncharacterized protein n=1 Tax=Pythium insidiosum TaxID=114742 RepID=A0AAD5QF16_PYTIN|nr:hypothetical protein P43SY_002516 [Pythium insidiosum]